MKLPRHKIIRRFQRLLLSRRLWRGRLVFWFGAICIGLAASAFAVIADKAQNVFAVVSTTWLWSPLVISPLVFALGAWLTTRFCPTAMGSGIPQAMAARTMQTRDAQRYLLGPRVILGKMALTALVLLGGASVGREGPTVQVSAAIMVLCAGLSGMRRQRGIVLAGAAAGVAAAFNTPVAGIVFAIEEMARGFQHRNTSIVLMTIVLSGAASMSILGNYNYFGIANEAFNVGRDWWPVIVIGVIGGIGGSLFAWALVDGVRLVQKAFGGYLQRQLILFAGLCGLAIAILGIITHA